MCSVHCAFSQDRTKLFLSLSIIPACICQWSNSFFCHCHELFDPVSILVSWTICHLVVIIMFCQHCCNVFPVFNTLFNGWHFQQPYTNFVAHIAPYSENLLLIGFHAIWLQIHYSFTYRLLCQIGSI